MLCSTGRKLGLRGKMETAQGVLNEEKDAWCRKKQKDRRKRKTGKKRATTVTKKPSDSLGQAQGEFAATRKKGKTKPEVSGAEDGDSPAYSEPTAQGVAREARKNCQETAKLEKKRMVHHRLVQK